MSLDPIHSILFNMHILYSFILGIWGVVTAVRRESISGNYWGAVAIATILAAAVLLVGIVMSAQGLRVARTTIYYLYMGWLVIVMPGLYSILRGRDDRSAAVAFSLLSFFNCATSVSMFQRGLIGPWAPEQA